MKIDPKLKYLAETAARDEERTLSGFIDRAIRLALETKRKRDDAEPNPGDVLVAPPPPEPLWGEGIWDEDEADRFFKLAVSRHDLLSVPEQRFWKLFQLCETSGKGIKAFREFWNHPMIDTKHLTTTSGEDE
jgi:hypothetical protein